MSKKKNKKIKVRQFWPCDPATQVHKDVKNDYNRSKSKQEIQDEIDEALNGDADYEEYDDLF